MDSINVDNLKKTTIPFGGMNTTLSPYVSEVHKSQMALDCFIDKDGYLKSSSPQYMIERFGTPHNWLDGCWFMTTWERENETYIIWASNSGVFFVRWSKINDESYEPERMIYENGNAVYFNKGLKIDVVRDWGKIFFINAIHGDPTVEPYGHIPVCFNGVTASGYVPGKSALYGCSYYESLVLVDANEPNQLIWSLAGVFNADTQTWTKGKLETFPEENKVKVAPYDGDRITKIIVAGGSLFALKQSHIYRVMGLPAADIRCISTKEGCPTGKACMWNGNLYFINSRGHLCVTGGGDEDIQEVSAEIEPTIKGFNFPQNVGIQFNEWGYPWSEWTIWNNGLVINEDGFLEINKDETVTMDFTHPADPYDEYAFPRSKLGFTFEATTNMYINKVTLTLKNTSGSPIGVVAKICSGSKDELANYSWETLPGNTSSEIILAPNMSNYADFNFIFSESLKVETEGNFCVFIKSSNDAIFYTQTWRYLVTDHVSEIDGKIMWYVNGHWEYYSAYISGSWYKAYADVSFGGWIYYGVGSCHLTSNYEPLDLSVYDRVEIDKYTPEGTGVAVIIQLYRSDNTYVQRICDPYETAILLPYGDEFVGIKIYVQLYPDDNRLATPLLRKVTLSWFDTSHDRPIHLLPTTDSLNIIAQETATEKHKLLRWDGVNWTTTTLASWTNDCHNFVGGATSFLSYIVMANLRQTEEEQAIFQFFSDRNSDDIPSVRAVARYPIPQYLSRRILLEDLTGVTDLIRYVIINSMGTFKFRVKTDKQTEYLEYLIERTLETDLTQRIIGLPTVLGKWVEYEISRIPDTSSENWKLLPITIYHYPKLIGYESEGIGGE